VRFDIQTVHTCQQNLKLLCCDIAITRITVFIKLMWHLKFDGHVVVSKWNLQADKARYWMHQIGFICSFSRQNS